MPKTFKTFTKGMVKAATFGIIISGSLFPSVAYLPISNVANADTVIVNSNTNTSTSSSTSSSSSSSSSSTSTSTSSSTSNTSTTNVMASTGLGDCSIAQALTDGVVGATHNFNVGDSVTFSLTGAPAFTAATQVTVTNVLAAGLTFVSSTNSVGTYDRAGNVWNIGTLDGASAITLTITATVNAGTEGQTIATLPTINFVRSDCTQSSAVAGNTITINSAPIVTPTLTPTVLSADLSVTKTADVTSTTEGGTIHYTVTAEDLGSATSTDVNVTDALPVGLTFVSATSSEGSYVSSTGIWNVGSLSASSSATLDITATANTGTAGTTITNTAVGRESVNDHESNTGNNTASVSVAVQSLPVSCSAVINDQTFVSDTSNLVDGNPAVFVPLPYNPRWTASIPGAAWIWKTQYIDNPLITESSTFTKVINVSGTVTSATLDMNADNSFVVLVNGIQVGANPTEFNYFAENESHFDIASAMHNGTNTIQFVVTNWALANGTIATNPAGLLYSLDLKTNGCPSTGPVINYADLSVAKTADVTSTVLGGTIHYTIAVTDLGPSTSTGVVATDILPVGLTFVSATTSAGSYVSSTGAWTIGDLSANATATLNIAVTVNSGTAATTITNTAIVAESASSTDSNMGNNTASVSVAVASNACTTNCGGGGGTPTSTTADISIAKTVNNANPVGGDTVNFTITATDKGPDTSTFVDAHDALPIGLTFVSATSSQGTYNMSTGDWNIGTLSANATATLQIAATVDPRLAGTTIVNTATISQLSSIVDNDLSNNSSSVSVNVQPVVSTSTPIADIGIVKTVDNATPAEGATVNYTLTVSAFGPSTSTGVTATDTLPASLTFISATTSAGSYVSSTGAWTIGNMAASSTAKLVITAKVNTGTNGTTITNTGTVGENSNVTDSNLGNNSSSVSIAVPVIPTGCTSNCGGGGGGNNPTAEIGITKTVDNANPNAGDTIHYTLTVSATGPSTSFGVVANDVLPSGVTFVSATSSEGSYASSTGTWTVGTVNIGSQQTLVITAIVNAGTNGQTITNTGTVSESPTVVDQLSGNNSARVSITVGGNGGEGGGSVLGASTSTGQVLGASCGLYLTQYIHPIRKYLNDPVQVEKLEKFLNLNLGTNLPVTGSYSNADIAAVNQFQAKYHAQVLKPWLPLGLPTEFTPTSYVYQTTQRWINLIMCPPLNIPMPVLHEDTGV